MGGTATCAWGGATATYTYAAVGATNGPVVTVAAAASTTSAGRYITYTGLTANTAYDVYCATSTLISASTSVTTAQTSTGSYSRRRDLSVTFSIAFQSSAAATNAATALNTYMTGGTFVTDLTSCTYSSCSLSSVTGVTVTSAAVATASSSSSSSSSSSTTTSVSGAVSAATLSLGGLVAVPFALLRLQ